MLRVSVDAIGESRRTLPNDSTIHSTTYLQVLLKANRQDLSHGGSSLSDSPPVSSDANKLRLLLSGPSRTARESLI